MKILPSSVLVLLLSLFYSCSKETTTSHDENNFEIKAKQLIDKYGFKQAGPGGKSSDNGLTINAGNIDSVALMLEYSCS